MNQEITVLPVEEVTEIKTQITIVQEAANNLVVSSQMEADMATELLHNVKQIEKLIEERKTQITRPLMASLASIRGLFAPLETAHKMATKTIKEKILAYTILEQERIQIEQEKIVKKVSSGYMRADTAANKLENIGKDSPRTNVRTLKKVRIVDETAIPREWLEPSMTRITQAVLKDGITIPGVEIFDEKSIVAGR